MKIIHRISLNPSETQIRELGVHGISFEDIGLGVIVFSIEEGHRAWPAVERIIREWDTLDMVSTEYTRKELGQSEYLVMGPSWHHGYPQPEDAFGYIRETYTVANYCPKCGTGLEQRAPFRVSSTPKWGTKSILQLNWVFDEFFVTPEVWSSVFKPLGLGSIPVLHHKTGRCLESIVQLQISDHTASVIDADEFVAERCSSCNRVKLGKRLPGRFPHVKLSAGCHIAKTQEYFGTGAAAWHEIIVSKSLYQSIAGRKLKGASFNVVRGLGEERR